MSKTIRIGLIGDYDPNVKAHNAIPPALRLSSESLGVKVEFQWLPTDEIGPLQDEKLSEFDGLWCVPAGPYRSMEGALTAIRYAREKQVPFLGTCAGFQHAIVEYARNVLKIAGADHEEINHSGKTLLITRLSCSLVEVSGAIKLQAGTISQTAYGRSEVTEEYHCNFGFNSDFRHRLENHNLKIAGEDNEGEVRIIELANHPFFVATLFQPERAALRGAVHPVITKFLQAASTNNERTK